ncbi:MNIO family bufferin maturase [Marinomonas fungiae]|uniref:Uncharacterized conserved protein, UPF0276 family n=1 Tax=Marinomonas fungiae TaxID=1137284 RepID=A0A0K6INA4_9GAMM|nr:DUF692 domain-containing protein [Marinomonas fungiae]CUB04573.1 Uncharacterized conserved protein, UPF0276 family [Marinomonas fungiae]
MNTYLKQQTEGSSLPSGFAQRTGISLKPSYYEQILQERPEVGFFEIHAENYLSPGGPAHYYLERIREHYELTVHGVGLSLGGEEPLNLEHLERVAQLVERVQPAVFSEHLAWSTHQQNFLNDLLPVPYTEVRLAVLCEHVDQVQSHLQRQILIENPSTYFEFNSSAMSETDFISELVKRTGCGLLLDVNNVEVSCFNHQRSAAEYLRQFPMQAVRQIHLAGYTLDEGAQPRLKIDSHDQAVAHEVWQLYQHALELIGDCPTLIERDGNFPELSTLLQEAAQANQIRHLVKEIDHAAAI